MHIAHNVKAKVVWHKMFTISCFKILLQTHDYDKYIDVGWHP